MVFIVVCACVRVCENPRVSQPTKDVLAFLAGYPVLRLHLTHYAIFWGPLTVATGLHERSHQSIARIVAMMGVDMN